MGPWRQLCDHPGLCGSWALLVTNSAQLETAKLKAVGSLHVREGPLDFFCFRKLGKRKQSGISPRWAWAGLGSGIPGDTGLWAGYSTGKYKFLDLMIFFVIILLRSGNFSSSQWCLNLGLLTFWLSLVIHRDYSFFFCWGWGECSLTHGKEINQWQWLTFNKCNSSPSVKPCQLFLHG